MKYHHLLILVWIAFLGGSYSLGYTPIALGVIFLLASLLSYCLYAKDKSAARIGSWRVSENTLHLTALLCGWPGALIAQQRLRHKTKKSSFRVIFWLSVLLNIAAITWLHSTQGQARLDDVIYGFDTLVISSVPDEIPVSCFHTLKG